MVRKMPSGTPKKTARKPLIGSDNKRKAKKGNSIPKTVRKRPAPRFYEVKILINAEEYAWGLPYFDEQKYLSKFMLESYREKVKRAEAHDKEAKQRALISNMNLLEPVLQEMFRQGKLDFLNGKTGWEK
jgi:hypothetical protein